MPAPMSSSVGSHILSVSSAHHSALESESSLRSFRATEFLPFLSFFPGRLLPGWEGKRGTLSRNSSRPPHSHMETLSVTCPRYAVRRGMAAGRSQTGQLYFCIRRAQVLARPLTTDSGCRPGAASPAPRPQIWGNSCLSPPPHARVASPSLQIRIGRGRESKH